jgi:7-keto-8-aminopelargonate synthetase-like enzyme
LSASRAALFQRLQDLSEKYVGDAVAAGICRVRVTDEVLTGDAVTIDGRRLNNFGTAAYLGLNTDPRLKQGAITAIERFGPVFSSSTAYTSIDLYTDLEDRLRQIFGTPVVVPTTTTLGHLGTLPVLVGPKDVVIIDAQAHASLHLATEVLVGEGIPVIPVPHNDMAALEKAIITESRRARRVWYLADGVYSMHGDAVPVADLQRLLEDHEQLHMYIDDAHGFGWKGLNGRGHVLSGMPMHPRLTVAVSLAKSFGSGGAAITFHDESFASSVVLRGGTFIFSGPLHPAELGAAVASADIHLSAEHAERAKRLDDQITLTRSLLAEHRLPVASTEQTPIWFVEIGGVKEATEMVRRLMASGFYVNVGIYPAVPLNRSGIRFAHALYHSQEQIRSLIEAVAQHGKDLIDDTEIVVDLTGAARSVARADARHQAG